MTDFQLEYNKLWEQEHQLIQQAKLFIEQHYSKVADWKPLTLWVKNGSTTYSRNPLEYGRYSNKVLDETNAFDRILFRSDSNCGTVQQVEVILDHSDWDLSLTITNTEGKTLQWFWIDKEAVINLAAYIQQHS